MFVSNDDFMRSYIRTNKLDNVTEGNFKEEEDGDEEVVGLNSPSLKINNYMSEKSIMNTTLMIGSNGWTASDMEDTRKLNLLLERLLQILKAKESGIRGASWFTDLADLDRCMQLEPFVDRAFEVLDATPKHPCFALLNQILDVLEQLKQELPQEMSQLQIKPSLS